MKKHLELDSTKGSTAFMTYSGHAFDIFDPETWVFDIDDIGHALSNTCRFGGHAHFYSVAEHCCRVANWLQDHDYDDETVFMGLMHDAIEAYIGDVVRPIKKTATLGGESIMDLEKSMEYALFSTYGLVDEHFDERWDAVKKGDWAVFERERQERPYVGEGLLPAEVLGEFLSYYEFLTDKLSLEV